MKSVKIFGLDVLVAPKKDLLKEQAVFGYYSIEEKTIYYDADLPPKTMRLTIRHEMGHAMWDRLGLSLNEKLAEFEESFCEQNAIIFSENEDIFA
jgi:Zn-dependent peptidase ImmA (M78 family)